MTSSSSSSTLTATKVWVLAIEHRHGMNIGVYTDRAALDNGLLAYVIREWHDECEEEPPEDNEEMITRYFELVDDESYCASEVEVKGNGAYPQQHVNKEGSYVL
jgi:hypothetical protein